MKYACFWKIDSTFLYGHTKSHVAEILQSMNEEIINCAIHVCISLDILCFVGGDA